MTKRLDGLSESDFRDQESEMVQELNSQLKEKDKILKKYKASHGKLEVFFRDVISAVPAVSPLPITYIPSQKDKNTEKPCPVVFHITDGHMGAVQEPEEIEDFGSFSPDLCRSRSLDFVTRALGWVDMHRHAHYVPEANLVVTGDMISGDIHDELKITNAFPSTVQCVEAGFLLAEQVAIVAQRFDKVIIHFLVADNHSRLTRKPQSKEEGLNSFNYVVGKIAEQALIKHSNVDFRIYPQYEKVITISKMQYLITHGHNLRGWMGIPWYSFDRHVGKESLARMSQIMNSPDIKTAAAKIGFHKMITGHFHTPFDHPLYCCGGSVSGTDAYDHKSGRYAEPSQCAWFIHPTYGEFDRSSFIL